MYRSAQPDIHFLRVKMISKYGTKCYSLWIANNDLPYGSINLLNISYPEQTMYITIYAH